MQPHVNELLEPSKLVAKVQKGYIDIRLSREKQQLVLEQVTTKLRRLLPQSAVLKAYLVTARFGKRVERLRL